MINESENISGESIGGGGAYSGAVLINFFVPDAALIRGRRLIEGVAYSSKYGIRKMAAYVEKQIADVQ